MESGSAAIARSLPGWPGASVPAGRRCATHVDHVRKCRASGPEGGRPRQVRAPGVATASQAWIVKMNCQADDWAPERETVSRVVSTSSVPGCGLPSVVHWFHGRRSIIASANSAPTSHLADTASKRLAWHRHRPVSSGARSQARSPRSASARPYECPLDGRRVGECLCRF